MNFFLDVGRLLSVGGGVLRYLGRANTARKGGISIRGPAIRLRATDEAADAEFRLV
jgi:hypothetical protein